MLEEQINEWVGMWIFISIGHTLTYYCFQKVTNAYVLFVLKCKAKDITDQI